MTGKSDRVQSGEISADDLEAAKQYWLGRHQRSAQTVAGTWPATPAVIILTKLVNDYEPSRSVSKQLTTHRIHGRLASECLAIKSAVLAYWAAVRRSRELADQLNEQVKPLWTS